MLRHPAKMQFINTDRFASGEYGYGTNMSPRNQLISLPESQRHIINPTNPSSALDDRIQDRLHVCGRAADNAEHLGCCRLMLQGLAQYCIALLNLLEQSHVFDGDNGLVGEGFEKGDLFVGERTNLRAADGNSPNRETLAQQRHGKHRASANT